MSDAITPAFHRPPTLGDVLFQGAEAIHRNALASHGATTLSVPQCLAVAGCMDAAAEAYRQEYRFQDRDRAENMAEHYRCSAREMMEEAGGSDIAPRWAEWRRSLAAARPSSLAMPAPAELPVAHPVLNWSAAR